MIRSEWTRAGWHPAMNGGAKEHKGHEWPSGWEAALQSVSAQTELGTELKEMALSVVRRVDAAAKQ